MPQKYSSGRSVGRWVCLLLLLSLAPMLLSADSEVADHRRKPVSASTGAATTVPAPTVSPTVSLQPSPTINPSHTVYATAEEGAPDTASPGEIESILLFIDADDQAKPTPAATQAALQAREIVTPSPSPDPGTWSFQSDTIDVIITRHKQGGFVYFAADIQLTSPQQLSYAFSHEKFGAGTEALSDIATRHDPVIAINGDYYSFHNNGIIIRGGVLFRANKSSRHLLIVEPDGDLRALTDRSQKQALVAAELMEEGALHTFEFGPLLVQNGQPVKLQSAIVRVAEGYLEPRTAIGQLGPLHYLVIVVDGRSPGYSEGCDLPALQQLFIDHGASFAFNLDGGGSTTLWFEGEVINQPASGDERKVSDIVMFMRQ